MEVLRLARGRKAWAGAAAAAAAAAAAVWLGKGRCQPPGSTGDAELPPPPQPAPPPPRFGKRIAVLSIDGGGIRGLIPMVVIASLEKELQVMNLSLYIFVI
jgi:hypothetical protein